MKIENVAGLPAGPPSQLPRPTTTMSAPTTPSVPSTTNIVPSISLPTTPSGPTTTSPPSSPIGERVSANSDQNRSPLNQGKDPLDYIFLYFENNLLDELFLLFTVYIYIDCIYRLCIYIYIFFFFFISCKNDSLCFSEFSYRRNYVHVYLPVKITPSHILRPRM